MAEHDTPVQRKRLGKIVSVAIPAAALITGLLVITETTRYPRTDAAEVFANFIGIAPQVDGPITTLAMQDNAFIKQGELLFEIDPRPYEYALQRARSDLSTLEGQIVDATRTIASQEIGAFSPGVLSSQRWLAWAFRTGSPTTSPTSAVIIRCTAPSVRS